MVGRGGHLRRPIAIVWALLFAAALSRLEDIGSLARFTFVLI
jgi:hypothetical protein